MDPGGKGGSGLCSDAIILAGNFLRKWPAWSIALLFKKEAKVCMGYKNGSKKWEHDCEVIE